MGDIRVIDSAGETMNFSIQKGFIEVINNEVAILVQGLATA